MAEHCKWEAGRLLTQPTLAVPSGPSSLRSTIHQGAGDPRALGERVLCPRPIWMRRVVLSLATTLQCSESTCPRAHVPGPRSHLCPHTAALNHFEVSKSSFLKVCRA